MIRVREEAIAGPAVSHAGRTDPVAQNRTGSVSVPVRVYEPEARDLRSMRGFEGVRGLENLGIQWGRSGPWGTLVWAHGGSFVRGTLDWPEADWVSRQFAEAGLRVYSVDYVLASDKVKAPGPSNDIAAVLREVRARHTGPMFVGGASAGGHLAVLAALAQAGAATSLSDPTLRPDALALVYPTLHRSQRPDTEISALTAALPEERRFGPERIAEMYDFYLAEDPLLPSPAEVAGELPAARLAALPPTIIVNAEADELRASAEQFAEQLREAGVDVTECMQPGTVHGYLNRPEESQKGNGDAQATIAIIANQLMQTLAGGTGELHVADPLRLATMTTPEVVAGLPLLPTPLPWRTSPVGYGRIFWHSFVVALLSIVALIALSFIPIADGMPFIALLDGYELVSGVVLALLICVIVFGGTWLLSRRRVRAALKRDPHSFVIGLMSQSAETFDELRALGGTPPRYGQFGVFTLSASSRGMAVLIDRGRESLRIAQEDVLEIRIDQRQFVMGGARSSTKPREAMIFVLRCAGGARQLSLFVGDPRWLGALPLNGKRLLAEQREIERSLQLG